MGQEPSPIEGWGGQRDNFTVSRQFNVNRDMHRRNASTHVYTHTHMYTHMDIHTLTQTYAHTHYVILHIHIHAHTHSQIVYFNWSVVNAPLRIKRQTGFTDIVASRLVILKFHLDITFSMLGWQYTIRHIKLQCMGVNM